MVLELVSAFLVLASVSPELVLAVLGLVSASPGLVSVVPESGLPPLGSVLATLEWVSVVLALVSASQASVLVA